jgi:hypothetical protein
MRTYTHTDAMGFDRIVEAKREIALLDAVWAKMVWWIERSLDAQFQHESAADGGVNEGSKVVTSLKARNVPSLLVQERWIELFYATHERQRSMAGGVGLDDDEEANPEPVKSFADRTYTNEEMPGLMAQFLMLPDQYKLALE